jgi:hypothetical protein
MLMSLVQRRADDRRVTVSGAPDGDEGMER